MNSPIKYVNNSLPGNKSLCSNILQNLYKSPVMENTSYFSPSGISEKICTHNLCQSTPTRDGESKEPCTYILFYISENLINLVILDSFGNIWSFSGHNLVVLGGTTQHKSAFILFSFILHFLTSMDYECFVVSKEETKKFFSFSLLQSANTFWRYC